MGCLCDRSAACCTEEHKGANPFNLWANRRAQQACSCQFCGHTGINQVYLCECMHGLWILLSGIMRHVCAVCFGWFPLAIAHKAAYAVLMGVGRALHTALTAPVSFWWCRMLVCGCDVSLFFLPWCGSSIRPRGLEGASLSTQFCAKASVGHAGWRPHDTHPSCNNAHVLAAVEACVAAGNPE